VKRRDLLRHLEQHGCEFLREAAATRSTSTDGKEGIDDSPPQRNQPGPGQKDLQGPGGASSRRLTPGFSRGGYWGCRRLHRGLGVTPDTSVPTRCPPGPWGRAPVWRLPWGIGRLNSITASATTQSSHTPMLTRSQIPIHGVGRLASILEHRPTLGRRPQGGSPWLRSNRAGIACRMLRRRCHSEQREDAVHCRPDEVQRVGQRTPTCGQDLTLVHRRPEEAGDRSDDDHGPRHPQSAVRPR